MNDRLNGKVSRIGRKGYGFISSDDGVEYFLHENDVEAKAKLKQGDIISFVHDKNERGLIAREVRLVKKKSPEAKRNLNQKHTKTKSRIKNKSASSYFNSRILSLLLIASVVLNLYLIFS